MGASSSRLGQTARVIRMRKSMATKIMSHRMSMTAKPAMPASFLRSARASSWSSHHAKARFRSPKARCRLVLPSTLAIYALLMDADFGLVPSLMVLIVGCALAHKDVHWVETIVLSIFVTAAAVAIFVYGLGLPYRLFWWSQ